MHLDSAGVGGSGTFSFQYKSVSIHQKGVGRKQSQEVETNTVNLLFCTYSHCVAVMKPLTTIRKKASP